MRVTKCYVVPLEPPSYPKAMGSRNSGESLALSVVTTERKLDNTSQPQLVESGQPHRNNRLRFERVPSREALDVRGCWGRDVDSNPS